MLLKMTLLPASTSERRDWLVTFAYVGFIYATLGVVRVPIAYLRSHGLLRISLGILYLICIVFLLSALSARHARQMWRYAVFLAVAALYFGVARKVSSPEEQIHFFEYGLVGVFFARALRHRLGNGGSCLLAALVLAGLTGWMDEVLQGMIPNRHYDVRDIALNIVSAGLGLVIYRILPPPAPKAA